ncbi:MAG: hypothetical protein ACR2PT_02090, partial [Endozoicomonas sp.]
MESRMRKAVSRGEVFPLLHGANEVRAAKDIQPFELLGHYAGELHDDETLEALMDKYGQDKVSEYSMGVTLRVTEYSTEDYVISGYPESNLSSLINASNTYATELQDKGIPVSFTSQKTVPANVNAVSATKGEEIYVFMFSTERIPKGEVLWFDYGIEFWKRLNESRVVGESDSEGEHEELPLLEASVAMRVEPPFFSSDGEESDMETETSSSSAFQLGIFAGMPA